MSFCHPRNISSKYDTGAAPRKARLRFASPCRTGLHFVSQGFADCAGFADFFTTPQPFCKAPQGGTALDFAKRDAGGYPHNFFLRHRKTRLFCAGLRSGKNDMGVFASLRRRASRRPRRNTKVSASFVCLERTVLKTSFCGSYVSSHTSPIALSLFISWPKTQAQNRGKKIGRGLRCKKHKGFRRPRPTSPLKGFVFSG